MSARSPSTGTAVSIVGAGPTGALLALLLLRRGRAVTLYESRPDPRGVAAASGRSINLALAARGIHALQAAGVYPRIAAALMPMRGRMIHQPNGANVWQPYGQRPDEVIYSVSRHRLNQALLDVAAAEPQLELRFEHRLIDADFESGTAQMQDAPSGTEFRMAMAPLLAADGAGSVLRRRMAAAGLIEAAEVALDHGYKELSIPADAAGGYSLAHDALHIWPRGNFMLIALPNTDGSFTATLFLPQHGAVSFDSLKSPEAVEHFLRGQFPDAYAVMPECVTEFERNHLGSLGTVYARGWQARGMAGLVGDAAHAIVPFHGQGMNCCFEDCLEFDACAERNATWAATFEEFFASRKPNTDAIAAMALENYLEMRERVADPRFRLQQALALELERRHPQRFIPRYSMVTFHHEIPYAVALERGRIQAALLDSLTADVATLEAIDYARAERDITLTLSPLDRERAPK